MSLRDRVESWLETGWLPWVRPNDAGTGEVEVWAKEVDGNVFQGPELTATESELVSDIMHNRRLEKPVPPGEQAMRELTDSTGSWGTT